MNKTVLTILFSLFIFLSTNAESIEKSTVDNIETNKINVDENNKELIGLLRKNSQQAFIIIELQKKIMILEYNLNNINDRLKNLESEVYKNMKY